MKRLLFALSALALACCLAFAAGKAEISFVSTKLDAGNVAEAGGAVKYKYEFTNTGSDNLIIISVSNGGCGCTKPSYPKAPIPPGGKGVITIEFNPSGRRGEYNREVKVRSNATKKNVKLQFSGVVIPGQKK